jgi:flagellin-like hook-associated protein FlgL
MKKLSLLLALGLGVGVVACGDDSDSGNGDTTDTGTTDTGTTDTGADTGSGDTGLDTGTTDTGTTDTGTTDTGTEDTAPPPTGEQWTGPYSYLWRLQIPQSGTAAECCFDFTGDGVTDNGLGTLVGALGAIAPDTDLQQTLDDAVAGGDIALLIEYYGLDKATNAGATQLWFYLGSNDVDGDGSGDQAWDPTLKNGEGVFLAKASSLDESGEPLIKFESAGIAEDVLTAGPGDFPLSIPIPDLLTLNVTIQQAQLNADVRSEATGIFTTDEEIDADEDGTAELWGGGKLGGVIPVDQVISILNDLANDCACAGVPADANLIIAGEGADAYEVACDPDITINDGACTDADGLICGNLGTVCGFAPALPTLGLIDVDTNENAVPDAISVGIRVSMSGAAIPEPHVQDDAP